MGRKQGGIISVYYALFEIYAILKNRPPTIRKLLMQSIYPPSQHTLIQLFLRMRACRWYYEDRGGDNPAKLFEALCFLDGSDTILKEKIYKMLHGDYGDASISDRFTLDEIDSQIIGLLDKKELDTFVANNAGTIALKFLDGKVVKSEATRRFAETIRAMRRIGMNDEEIAQSLQNAGVNINDKASLTLVPLPLHASYQEGVKPENLQFSLLQKALFERINETEVEFFLESVLDTRVGSHDGKSIAQIQEILVTYFPELIRIICCYDQDNTPDHRRKSLISHVIKRTLLPELLACTDYWNSILRSYRRDVMYHIVYRLEQLERDEVQPKCEIDLSLYSKQRITVNMQEREFLRSRIAEAAKRTHLEMHASIAAYLPELTKNTHQSSTLNMQAREFLRSRIAEAAERTHLEMHASTAAYLPELTKNTHQSSTSTTAKKFKEISSDIRPVVVNDNPGPKPDTHESQTSKFLSSIDATRISETGKKMDLDTNAGRQEDSQELIKNSTQFTIGAATSAFKEMSRDSADRGALDDDPEQKIDTHKYQISQLPGAIDNTSEKIRLDSKHSEIGDNSDRDEMDDDSDTEVNPYTSGHAPELLSANILQTQKGIILEIKSTHLQDSEHKKEHLDKKSYRRILLPMLISIVAILGLGLILVRFKKPASFVMGKSIQKFGLATPNSKVIK